MATLDNDRMVALATRIASVRDQSAFAELFDHFAPRLNAYMRKLGLEAAQAEEITQEVMFTLWHKADLFDPAKSNLSTWLFRIARNRRIDTARRARSAEIDQNDPWFLPEEIEAPDAGIDQRKRELAVRETLETLPAEQLEIVQMAFYLGLSHSEIAERCGLPLGTVKSRIRLAFTRMRARFDADPQVDGPG